VNSGMLFNINTNRKDTKMEKPIKFLYTYDGWNGWTEQEVEIKKIGNIYCLKVNVTDRKVVKLIKHAGGTWHVNGELHGSYTPIYPIDRAERCFSEGTHKVEVLKLRLDYVPEIDDYIEENGVLTPKTEGRLEEQWDEGLDIKIIETKNSELSSRFYPVNFGYVFVNGVYIGDTIHYVPDFCYEPLNEAHFLRIKDWADTALLAFFDCDEFSLSKILYEELVDKHWPYGL